MEIKDDYCGYIGTLNTVFASPQNMHILTGCPHDLARLERRGLPYMVARQLCIELDAKYAPKNPSGYPASIYKICTDRQWDEYQQEQEQLAGDWTT